MLTRQSADSFHAPDFRRRYGRRSGRALVLCAAIVPTLLAIASISVDLGRVELARTEMRRAVNAAARAACAHLPLDTTTARIAAQNLAERNTVDGSPLVLYPQDITFGFWNTSTKKFDSNASTVNAVRINAYRTKGRSNPIPMTFARVLGYPAQDVWFSQTSMILTSSAYGFVGSDSFKLKNNLFAASYNSNTTTTPSHSNYRSNGSIASNGSITGGNNNLLRGSITIGPAGSVSGITATGGTTFSGTALPVPASPAWTPAANPVGIASNYTSSGAKTLVGGTYWFTGLTISGTLTFSGPATLYINGNVDLNGTLRAYNAVPANLKIYVIGSHTFGDSGNNHTDITADIEAPNAAFVAKNTTTLRGRMTFKSFEFKNSADLYYDEAIAGVAGGAGIVNVE